jgi:hypothetical protein
MVEYRSCRVILKTPDTVYHDMGYSLTIYGSVYRDDLTVEFSHSVTDPTGTCRNRPFTYGNRYPLSFADFTGQSCTLRPYPISEEISPNRKNHPKRQKHLFLICQRMREMTGIANRSPHICIQSIPAPKCIHSKT